MDFRFILDLEYADFHETLESDRPPPPKSDNHNNSNYAYVKDFDGSSQGLQAILSTKSVNKMAGSLRFLNSFCMNVTENGELNHVIVKSGQNVA